MIGAISNALGDVPIPDLPLVAVAPEYMEQKATIDAVFALALGLYTYVNPVPNVTGAPNLVRLLTQELSGVTGGLLDVEGDATKAADNLLGHIQTRRDKLGI
jgi:carbon-monoxide dehydrogenase catalytic subunit